MPHPNIGFKIFYPFILTILSILKKFVAYNLIYRRSLSWVLIKATEHQIVKLLILVIVESLAANRIDLLISYRSVE